MLIQSISYLPDRVSENDCYICYVVMRKTITGLIFMQLKIRRSERMNQRQGK